MSGYELFIILVVLGMMLCGLVGIFLPYLPGVMLIWGGIFIYALIENFQRLDHSFVFFISLLAIFASGLDYIERTLYSRGVRQKSVGAAILGGMIGVIVGSFLGGVYWLFVVGFLGALIGEVLSGRDSVFVLETNKYKIVSFLGATLFKITLASVMILLFLERVFLV